MNFHFEIETNADGFLVNQCYEGEILNHYGSFTKENAEQFRTEAEAVLLRTERTKRRWA